jgi:signal transduction histidine kinase
VAATEPGERAVELPWFWPDAKSFQILLDHSEAIPWLAVRADPGLLFFVLSQGFSIEVGEEGRSAATEMLADSTVPWMSWRDPAILPVVRTTLAASHFAEILGAVVGVEPNRAWAGTWLAFGGWLAVGVVEPAAVTEYLSNPDRSVDPFGLQSRLWGKTRAEIAWQLSNLWQMPQWAGVVLGRLDATPESASHLGGDRRLQAVVQIAIVLAEQIETRLYVADEFDLAAALAELGVRSADLDWVRERYAAEVNLDAWLDRDWTSPIGQTSNLLDYDGQIENLSHVEEPSDELADHIHAAKLAALAEFAAGASHEINNPLAVISGQSQYLLRHETDETRRRALQSIVRQTRRIHSVLTELMYFARPPAPRREWVELGRLIREATTTVASAAAERDIDVQLDGIGTPLWVDVDPKQIATALAALIRNGVEAVPAKGWVRIAVVHRQERLDIVVQDNGPGLDERSREHLFDPFYSGRTAGRGRGLGLSAAWRLVREHGGDVRYVPIAGGPTQFVLTLPGSVVVTGAQRKSA